MQGVTFDSRELRDVLGCFATGVCVVTCCTAAGTPHGVTINSFASVSLDPPLVLFSLDRANTSLGQFHAGEHFASKVRSRQQQPLSRRFAAVGGDRWEGLAFETWGTGCPIFPESLAVLECEAYAHHEAGDHMLFLGRVLRLHRLHEGEPLLFFRGAYRELRPND